MENQWDNIDDRRDLTIRGLFYGSILCFFLGLLFVVLYEVYPDYTRYMVLYIIFFILVSVLIIVTCVTIVRTGEELNEDSVHNAAISPGTEMSTVTSGPPFFSRRQNTVVRPDARSTSGRSSRLRLYSRMWSSYVRAKILVPGIPRGSDRVRGRWTEPDTPAPDANLRRPEDIEEESERDLFEEAFPEESRQRVECELHQRF